MQKKGFTVVEMLIVMTIIIVLMGISLVSYSSSKKSARDAKRKADLASVSSILEIYRTDCREYPATGSLVWGSSLIGDSGNAYCAEVEFTASLPVDSASPTYRYYYVSANSNAYSLCAHLEGVSGASLGDCGNNCGNASATCNYRVTNP